MIVLKSTAYVIHLDLEEGRRSKGKKEMTKYY